MRVLETHRPAHRHRDAAPVQPRHAPRDLIATAESMQLMIDLVREDSKVSQPFTTAQVVDYSFVEKARRELGANR